MAKLKAPLLSLGASGQLAKALVFFPWKGLNVVREYVIPSNPNTTAQDTHRAYLTAAVAAIHSTQANAAHPQNSADQIAYSTLAQAKGKIMTWFNQACKLWIDVKVAVKIPVIYHYSDFVDKSNDNISFHIDIEEETPTTLAAGKLYFGTSKTNLINAVTAEVLSGVNVGVSDEDLSAFLTVGTKYYVQFRPDAGDGCVGADSGIYSFVAE